MLDFDGISISHAQGQDVQKLHLCMDVSMQTTMVLEHHIFLRIFDTHLGVQGMEDIGELLLEDWFLSLMSTLVMGFGPQD